MLGLVTANTILWNKFVWNLITSALFEENLLKLTIDIVLVYLSIPSQIDYTPYDQFALYLLITTLLSSIATSTYCLIRFFSTGRESMLLEPIFGCSGLIIALMMYARKSLGKTPIISLFGNMNNSGDSPLYALIAYISYNNSPLIIISLLLTCWLFRIRYLALDCCLAICSCIISWSYLRFFYLNEDGSYGTPMDEFAFVQMFPQVLNIIYDCIIIINIVI